MQELDLFALALMAPDQVQRAEILDRECRDNPELRFRIEALLEAHFQTHSLLDQGPIPLTEDQTRNFSERHAQVDTVIAGRYRLLEPIGEGGMGTVWRAKQTDPVKRFVAIKLIKAGMDSRQVLARFEAERQALALMDHPNIAKVLDGGLHEHRPYFVMELVKGTPITEYCDFHKLTPKSRLELFINVCEAIQHAHQKGIIHRDIKPRNVLVAQYDEKPVVKVIDFGVAKATGGALTEHSIDTGFGNVVGTPQYMSPEQATFNNLDVDTRSDIYALGVLLYELLTGAPPFSQKELEKVGLLEMLRVVREDEPPRPSTKLSTADALPSLAANRGTEPTRLASLLRNELDWIVMKALDKERVRRYQTAASFAADVQRFLGGEAIQAHPPSTAYRLRKLLRKNKAPVLAATLILMTLLLGMVGTGWQAIRAERARAKEETQRQIAEASEKRALQAVASEKEAHRQEATQRVRAEQATEKAEEILNAMVSGVAADSLTTQTAISEDQKKFLTGVLRYYRELAAEKEEDTPAKIANAAFRVGIIEDRLGRKSESEIAFREARDLYQKLTEDSSDGFKFRQRLTLCNNNLGLAASDKGETHEAEQSYREAIRVQEQIAGGAWLYTPEYQSDLALSHNNLGALYVKLGRKDDAKDEYQKALAIREKLAESFPSNPVYQAGLAKTHNHLGILSRSLDNRKAAEEHYSRALAIRQQLVSDFTANPQYTYELAASHFNIGNLRHDEKQWQPAEQQYLKALPMLEKLAAQYPSVPDYQADLGKCYTSLGGIFRRDGRLLEAEEMLRKGVAIQERQAAESPSDHERRFSVASSRASLSLLLQSLGKHADAETEIMTVCEIQEKLVTEYPDLAKYQLGLAGSYLSLGAMRSRSGRRAESIQPLAKAIQVLAPFADRDNKAKLALCDAYVGRARTYASLNQFTLALKDWEKAIELSSIYSLEKQANFRASRAITQMQLGEMEESLEEVLNLASNYSNSKGVQYSCACFFALAGARADDKKQEYETRAIESLMRAVAAGFDDAAHLKQDTDLDSLRGREDFKALVTKLEQAREKK